MITKHNVYRLLNIHASESPIVFRLLGIQFALGLATSFLVTASYALFLYKYNINSAPVVYILAAFLLFPINALYARLDIKLNSKKLLQFIILFAAGSMTLLLTLWTATKIQWLALLVVAWNLMLYMVVGYGYWGLASLMFNVRESRRIFSVIGAGDLPAKVIGYLFVHLLTPVIGIEAIMAVAVVFFLLAFFLCKKLFAHSGIDWEKYESEQHHVSHEPITNWWMKLFENRLIQWIAALSLVSYIIYLLIDFTFLSEIKVRYKSAHELAGFISLFFATGRLLAIVLKLVFSSRIINRLGLTKTLLVTPLVMLLMAITILLVPATPFAKTYLYGFGIMTLVSEVLRSTIQEPVFFILFQPMNIHLRLKGHLVAKGYVYPPALLLVGVGLSVWLHFKHSVPIMAILVLVAGLIIVWLLFIIRIREHYFDVVQRSIQKGFFSGISLFLNDDTVIKTLLNKARTSNTREKIQALSLLEKSGYTNLEKLFDELLQSNEPLIQAYVLERLQYYQYASSKPFVAALIDNTNDKDLQQVAFKTLCILDTGFLNERFGQWDELSPAYKQAVLAGLARHAKTGTHHSKLDQRLRELAASHQEADQLLLLNVMEEAPQLANIELARAIKQNAHTDATYNKLLETIGKLHLVTFLPDILHALNNKTQKHHAIQALNSMKDVLFEKESLPAKLDAGQHTQLVAIASKTKTEAASRYLMHLYQFDFIPSSVITAALWQQQTNPGTNAGHILNQQTDKLLSGLALKIDLCQQMDKNGHRPLWRAIHAEIQTDCLDVLRLLAIQYGRQKLSRVIELMDMERYSKMYNAIELLELTLPRQVFQQLNTVLEFLITGKLAEEAKKLSFPATAQAILTNASLFNNWTKALTWYLAGREPGDTALKQMVMIPDNNVSRIVKETKEFVIFNHNHKNS